jgi:ligand-binding sensor domain-containing protein
MPYLAALFFASVFLTGVRTMAQLPLEYTFRHINQAEGLLHNEVYAITQDGKGFIWIGSRKGVQRYDGLRFVNYIDSSDRAGDNNGVTNLYPDGTNNSIWVGKSYKFRQLLPMLNEFTSPDTKKWLQKGGEKYMSWDSTAWILQQYYTLHAENKKTKTSGNVLLGESNNRTVYFAPFIKDTLNNQTWVAPGNGKIFLFDGESRKVFTPDNNGIGNPLLRQLKGKTDNLRHVYIDSHRNIWITTWGRVFLRYNILTRQLRTYSVADFIQAAERKKTSTGAVNTILEDDHGAVWLATTNAGLLEYNPQNDHFASIVYQQGNIAGLEYNYEINSLFQDKEQNIWVGTDKGISIFNPYRQYFTVIKHDGYNRQSLPKNEINALLQLSGGDLMIGTWGGGISIYDKRFQFKKTISFADTIPKNEIWCFVQNDDGTVWAGCQKGYLHIIAPDKLSVQTIRPPELENSTIRCMIKDAGGNIWLGLQNGKILQWSKEKKMFRLFGSQQGIDTLPAAPITNMFIDRFRHFWVSTWNGFRELDTDRRIFTANYRPDKKNGAAISSLYCLGIEEYNDSILLVGTQEGGLNFFNRKTKIFSQLTTADGLPSNTVCAIKRDAAGYIWFTTEYTLCKFNPADKKMIRYLMPPGLVNASFSAVSFYTMQDGQWLTFTGTGVISFFPYKALYPDGQRIETVITGFKIFENPIFIDSLLDTNRPVF